MEKHVYSILARNFKKERKNQTSPIISAQTSNTHKTTQNMRGRTLGAQP